MAVIGISVEAIDRTRQGLASAGRNIDNTEKKVSRLGKAGRATAIGIAGIAAAAGGLAVKLGTDVVEATTELRKLSTISGVSAEKLQVLGRIAERTGGDTEDVADAFREMQLRLSEATGLGTGPATDALNLLGVSLHELNLLDAPAQFDLLRDAISQVEDPSRRLFIAEELLGGSVERLNGIINPTAGEFAALSDEVSRSGIITDEAVESVGRMQDRLQILKGGLLAGTANAFVHLEGAVLTAADIFEHQLRPAVKEHAAGAFEVLKAALVVLPIGQMARLVYRLARVFGDDLRAALDAVLGIMPAVWAGIVEGARRLNEFSEMTTGKVVDALTSLKSSLFSTGGTTDQVTASMTDRWQALTDRIGSLVGDVVGWWRDDMTPAAEKLGQVIADVVDGIVWAWQNILGPALRVVTEAVLLAWEVVRTATELLLMPILKAVAAVVAVTLVAAFKVLAETAEKAWTHVIAPVVAAAWTVIKPVIESMGAFFDWLADRIKDVRVAVEGLREGTITFGDIASAVASKITSPFIAGFNSLLGAIQPVVNAINAVIAAAQTAIDIVRSIPTPSIPSLPGGIDIPGIPFFADGGIVTRPTLGVIGEAGPEAVIPLNQLGRASAPMRVILEVRSDDSHITNVVQDAAERGKLTVLGA